MGGFVFENDSDTSSKGLSILEQPSDQVNLPNSFSIMCATVTLPYEVFEKVAQF